MTLRARERVCGPNAYCNALRAAGWAGPLCGGCDTVNNAVAMVGRSNARLAAETATPYELASNDARFTNGLVFDVFELLRQHGFHDGGPRCYARAMVELLRLVRAFEGNEVG